MFPQESSSPGTLGPHCPVGPLAPRFSRQALTPLAVPCPKTTPGVLAPRAPMAHALRLTPRPCGDGHVFLHVLWFKLSQSFCSGRHLEIDRVCKCATRRRMPSDHPCDEQP